MIDILRYHKITDRDREAPLLEVYNEGKQVTSGAESDITVNHTPIPLDQILVVQSWCILFVADPLNQTEPWQYVFGSTFVQNATTYFTGLDVAAPRNFEGHVEAYASMQNPMCILSQETPTAKVFCLVAGAHTINSRIRGWLIPKGNMGRGFGGL